MGDAWSWQVHPDMESERRQPSFDVERLTNILDGGAENTALRRKVGKEVGVGHLICAHKLLLEEESLTSTSTFK